MSLESQVAQLSQNVGNLVNRVATQADTWNNMVQNKINELEQWKQNANSQLNFVANDPKVKTALNASGDAPIYACRAWVNFTDMTSPPTIRASGNVSSVVMETTGIYIINFITAMPDTQYAVSLSFSSDSDVSSNALKVIEDSSNLYMYTTSVKVGVLQGHGGWKFLSAAIFR